MLEGRLQVQWEVFGDDVKIRISARIDEDQYVAFGLSGEDGKSQMLGGDVVVVAYDKHSKKFFAEDYYLSDLSECDGKTGVCPDKRIGGKNDAIYIDGKRNNGITTGNNFSKNEHVNCLCHFFRLEVDSSNEKMQTFFRITFFNTTDRNFQTNLSVCILN